MIVSVMTIAGFAQRTVTGKVVEEDTKDAVIQATASLLSGEKVVSNAVTNAEGNFSVKAPSDGTFTLRVTYVGFKTYTKKITVSDGKSVSAGTISLAPDAIMLQGRRSNRSEKAKSISARATRRSEATRCTYTACTSARTNRATSSMWIR